MSNYAFKKIEDIFEEFDSVPEGLTGDGVLINRQKFGENKINSPNSRSHFEIFFSQFNNLFSHVLLISAVLVYLLGDFIDFGVIVFIIIVNAIIGYIQEGKAQQVFEVLQKKIKSEALVLRDGERKKINDEFVVVGDIIFLKDGDKIPADARIIESNNLKLNEASLTGESSTVMKESVDIYDRNIQISDQKNMIFRGTYVVSGLATAIVTGIGKNTEMGKIEQKVSGLKAELPIKETIRNLSKIILYFVIILSIITFVFGIGYGYDIKEISLIVVALFVSAIPESLPVVLTVILATGFYRMSKKNILIKRLQAVDALGQTNVVALDKTGTITTNQMKVEKVYTNNNFFYVSGDGYEPKGKIFFGEKIVDIYEEESLQLMAKISATTSIGGFFHDDNKKQWEINYGDPTEVSLLVFGEKMGVIKEEFVKQHPVEKEIPFDMYYRHHSTINRVNNENVLYVTGAPEVVIGASSKIILNGEEVELTEEEIKKIKNNISSATKDGYRILCMAYKKNPENDLDPNKLNSLVFVGFVGIGDTIRKTVNDAIDDLRNAGMKAVMITGDYKETAIGIAKKAGIFKDGDRALTGEDINKLNDVQLRHFMEDAVVFARVTPEQKLKIISMYKARGEVIAMTGDGVNDVLSLVKADLGVSMGYGATDAAKEAADIILLDNNFGSLAHGVLEGRNIYVNIKKTAEYLISTNIAELLVIMFSVLAGLPIALTAIQILWLNLVTDSFLVIGFAFEPIDRKLSKIKNWKPSKYLLSKKSILKIIVISLTMTALTINLFLGTVYTDIIYAHTLALTILTILQVYNIFNIKSGDKSIFKTPILNNKWLLVGIASSVSLFLFAMYNPFLQKILEIKPIVWSDWVYILGLSLIVIVVEEIRKLFSK